jgi:hypothetical protein
MVTGNRLAVGTVPATEAVMSNMSNSFTQGYIECALWSSSAEIEPHTDQSFQHHNYDESDLAPETLEQMLEDCADFQESNCTDLENYAKNRLIDYAGHDFWLTRNGHGAGFWDRGLGELGKRLTTASKVYGSCDLYLGNDGLIYCS